MSLARSRAAWPAPPQKRKLPSRGPIQARLDRLEAELAAILPPPPPNPEAEFLSALTVPELVCLEGIYERAETGEELTTADRLRVVELQAAGWRRSLEGCSPGSGEQPGELPGDVPTTGPDGHRSQYGSV